MHIKPYTVRHSGTGISNAPVLGAGAGRSATWLRPASRSEQAAQTALGKHVGFDACLHIEEGANKVRRGPEEKNIYFIEIRFVSAA